MSVTYTMRDSQLCTSSEGGGSLIRRMLVLAVAAELALSAQEILTDHLDDVQLQYNYASKNCPHHSSGMAGRLRDVEAGTVVVAVVVEVNRRRANTARRASPLASQGLRNLTSPDLKLGFQPPPSPVAVFALSHFPILDSCYPMLCTALLTL